LEGFVCSTLDQPWSLELERMIRDLLPYALEALPMQGLGLWLSDELVAVDAWKPELDPAVVSRFGNSVWRNVLLATRNGYRRNGFARRLKRALIDSANNKGIRAISSIVSWQNHGMRLLNQEFGGWEEPIVTDMDPDPDYCRCIVRIDPF
jgi:GNAT superfamily N-acetyltransferase